jgi:hypothetical protein
VEDLVPENRVLVVAPEALVVVLVEMDPIYLVQELVVKEIMVAVVQIEEAAVGAERVPLAGLLQLLVAMVVPDHQVL